MPLTRTIGNYFDSSGSFVRRVERWSGPSSYVTGGEVLSAATLGFGILVAFTPAPALNAAGTAIRTVVWNPVTNRLMWFVTDTGLEVANGVDLSTFTFQYEAIGQ